MPRERVPTRRAAAIETLGSATELCTNKPGALPQNRMRIAELRLHQPCCRRCPLRLPFARGPIRCRSGTTALRRPDRMAGTAQHIGLYGFGVAAHIVAQVARWQGREVYAFTLPGDAAGQEFARTLGGCWAGGSDHLPPRELDAAILFAPSLPWSG